LRQNLCQLGSIPSLRGKAKDDYLLVFIGGGLGASLRHAINMICARGLGTAFPYGTFIINITGSTVMGLIAAISRSRAKRRSPGACS